MIVVPARQHSVGVAATNKAAAANSPVHHLHLVLLVLFNLFSVVRMFFIVLFRIRCFAANVVAAPLSSLVILFNYWFICSPYRIPWAFVCVKVPENANFVRLESNVTMKARIYFFFSVYLFLSVLFAVDAYADVYLKSWQMTTGHGLPNNSVRCLLQDYRGQIWIGTQNGLAGFNGNRVALFEPDSSSLHAFLSKKIRAVVETSSHRLWVLTGHDQAMCFDLVRRRFIPVGGTDVMYLPANHIHKDSSGHIWLWHSRLPKVYCVTDNERAGRRLHVSYIPLSSPVSFFHESSSGVWLGSGIHLLHVSPSRSVLVASGHVWKSAVTRNGRTYLASVDGHLFISGPERPLSCIAQLPPSSVVSSLVWWRGRLVVFTSAEAFVLNPATLHLSPCEDLSIPRADVVSTAGGTAWLSNSSGTLYGLNDTLSSPMRLHLLDSRQISAVDQERFCILQDSRGLVWIASYGNGLFLYDSADSSLKHYTSSDRFPLLGSDFLYCVMEDSSGDIWIGQQNAGLAHLFVIRHGAVRRFDTVETGSSSRSEVKSLSADADGRMFIARRDGIVDIRSVSSGKLLSTMSLPSPAYSMWWDSVRRSLWIGTRKNGLYVDGSPLRLSAESPLASSAVFAVRTDRCGRCWAGTFGDGLFVGMPSGSSWHFFNPFGSSLPVKQIRALAADSYGRFWAATDRGLLFFNPDSLLHDASAYTVFSPDNSGLRDYEINTLAVDGADRIWVGTVGHGVACCTLRGGRLHTRYFDASSGLASNEVQAIVEDSGHRIWVATQYGLSCKLPSSDRFMSYFLSPTLQGDMYSANAAVALSDGRLLFGTCDGIVFVSSDGMLVRDRVSRMPQLSEIYVNGTPFAVDEDSSGHVLPFSLPHDRNSLLWRFSNLDYSRFRSSRYSCFLEGYDDEWSVPMESGEFLYRNLPPGDYCLKVRSCNSSGIWCSGYASFRFTIRQPFYLTWWAWCIYAVLLVIVLTSAYMVTRKILTLKQKVKLEQELSAFKLRFFIQMVNDIRRPLVRLYDSACRLPSGNEQAEAVRSQASQMRSVLSRMLTFNGNASDADINGTAADSMPSENEKADSDSAKSESACVCDEADRSTENRVDVEAGKTPACGASVGECVSDVNPSTRKETSDFVVRLDDIVARNLSRPDFTVDEMAELLGCRRTTCYRKIKEATGMTPNDYLRKARLKHAAELLLDDRLNVSEVAYRVGFEDLSYFSKCFKAYFGIAPSGFVRRGR